MSESSLVTLGLAFLVPLGFALIAVGSLPAERSRRAAVAFLTAMGLAVVGYVLIGFALQFGGVGLAHDLPGFAGLIWEWSALGPTWGPGWGMAGLVGWGLIGPAATSAGYALALANLPWVITAALIPLIGLRGRIPAWASVLLGLLIGTVVYPLAGNWIWGGGWLANLGTNLGLGHGYVDVAGAGLVHLLGAAAALAGILIFLPRRPKSATPGQAPLPAIRWPLLALLGVVALLIGSFAWTVANPLLPRESLDLPLMALNGILAAAAGALGAFGYTWLVAGSPDPLMAARGLAAALVAATAFAPFVPPWAALAIGAVVGLLVPLAIFTVDRLLRWDDPSAVLTVHGLGGVLGLLALGIFADGKAGAGWNGVGVDSYLGVAGQGVTGLLAAAGYHPDWPAQIQAQGVGLVALALLAFFFTWLLLTPPAILVHLLRPQPVAIAPTSEALIPAAASSDIEAPAAADTIIEAHAPAAVAAEMPSVPLEVAQGFPEYDDMAVAI
jgi:ammonium transporter, Amt family